MAIDVKASGTRDEQKPAPEGSVEALGLAELTHQLRNDRIRAT